MTSLKILDSAEIVSGQRATLGQHSEAQVEPQAGSVSTAAQAGDTSPVRFIFANRPNLAKDVFRKI